MSIARACLGKVKHPKQAAITVARRMSRNGDSPVSAYRCSNCGGWHVGHASGHVIKAAYRGARRRAAQSALTF